MPILKGRSSRGDRAALKSVASTWTAALVVPVTAAAALTGVENCLIISLVRNVDEASVFAELIQRLILDFDELRAEDISKLVNTEVARFRESSIREFVPLFVERRVRAQLTKLEPALSYS